MVLCSPREHVRYAVYYVCQTLSAGALWALTGVRHFDVPDIASVGGLLVASNHQSYLDPTLVGIALPHPLHYLARESLFRVPGLGRLIHTVGAHPVKRGQADSGALRTVFRLLRGGEAVLIFPEGTRTRDGSLGTFQAGVGSIAVRCGVPVLPVCVEGSFECWPRHRWLPRPARVAVGYGRLVSSQDVEARTLTRAVEEQVRAMRKRLRAYLDRSNELEASGGRSRDQLPI